MQDRFRSEKISSVANKNVKSEDCKKEKKVSTVRWNYTKLTRKMQKQKAI